MRRRIQEFCGIWHIMAVLGKPMWSLMGGLVLRPLVIDRGLDTHCVHHSARLHSVISTPARFPANAGTLEAVGVSLALKWVLRTPRRHGRWTVLLVGARAVAGALRKGRSSAPSLTREIRHIAALVLAGGLRLKVLNVPSEHNPVDAPSRGLPRVRRQRISLLSALGAAQRPSSSSTSTFAKR